MEPYIFQSWGAVGQFTGLSGETKFPHLQMGSGWAGSPWDHSSRADAPALARLQVSLLLSAGLVKGPKAVLSPRGGP